MVRVLLMDRKQQVKGLLKGFQPKWSQTVHYVLKITKLRKNPNVHRYFIGLSQSYFRHELLVVPKVTDKAVPSGYIRHKQNVITEEDYEMEAEWEEGSEEYSD